MSGISAFICYLQSDPVPPTCRLPPSLCVRSGCRASCLSTADQLGSTGHQEARPPQAAGVSFSILRTCSCLCSGEGASKVRFLPSSHLWDNSLPSVPSSLPSEALCGPCLLMGVMPSLCLPPAHTGCLCSRAMGVCAQGLVLSEARFEV